VTVEQKKIKLPFQYQASFWGLLRIGLWCLAFLLLAGFLLPTPLPEDIPFTTAAKNAPVIPMVTIADDHRFIRADSPLAPSKLNILWISDSTSIVIAANKNFQTAAENDTRILPTLVAKELEEKYGLKNFDIHFYIQLGLRPLDNLVFSLEALHQKPDMIVMSFNYIYDFNPYKVIGQNAPLSLLPENFITKPELWPLIPLLASPADNLWAFGGRNLPIIRDAEPFKHYLEKNFLAPNSPWAQEKIQQNAKFDSPLNNVRFWAITQLLHSDAAPIMQADGRPSQKKLNEQLMASSVLFNNDSFSTESTSRIIKYYRESNIPVLLYMMPLDNSYYKNAATAAVIKNVKNYMDAAAAVPGGKLHIISEIPASVRRTMKFRPIDGVHILTPGHFAQYLTEQIWQQIQKNHLQKTKVKNNAQTHY
jgi:hypothetical protein